jgi:hypothetical protein
LKDVNDQSRSEGIHSPSKQTAVQGNHGLPENLKARQRVQLIHDSWKLGRDMMARSQARMVKSANAHRREVDFDVGDDVWLDIKHWNTARPSLKLDNNNSGPFKITARKGNSFKLQLPASMKIHPVMSPDKLRKSANDPLPGQVNKPEEPVEIAGDIEYEVEEVLAVKKQWNQLNTGLSGKVMRKRT